MSPSVAAIFAPFRSLAALSIFDVLSFRNAMRVGSSKGGVLDDPRRSSRDLRGEGRGLGPGRLLYLRESIGAVLALPLPALPAPVNHRVPRAPRTVDEVVFHGSPPGPR